MNSTVLSTTQPNSRPGHLMMLLQQNYQSSILATNGGGVGQDGQPSSPWISSTPSSSSPSSILFGQQQQQQQNHHQQTLHFSNSHKMSLFSLEKRIDYHLSRIMKGHRLINFKNSIERLPVEKRICECIIEVLISSLNLIARKTRIIVEAKSLADSLNDFARNPNSTMNLYNYILRLKNIRTLAVNLEQIVWALNSNKEHTKYIVKVFAVPENYERSEFSSDPNSIVPLRQSIIQTIQQCQEVITVCRILRQQIQNSVINSYLSHFAN